MQSHGWFLDKYLKKYSPPTPQRTLFKVVPHIFLLTLYNIRSKRHILKYIDATTCHQHQTGTHTRSWEIKSAKWRFMYMMCLWYHFGKHIYTTQRRALPLPQHTQDHHIAGGALWPNSECDQFELFAKPRRRNRFAIDQAPRSIVQPLARSVAILSSKFKQTAL